MLKGSISATNRHARTEAFSGQGFPEKIPTGLIIEIKASENFL